MAKKIITVTDELLTLYKDLEQLVSQVKESKRSPLYLDDPEFKKLEDILGIIMTRNSISVLTLTDTKIFKLIRDIYPIYVNVRQFLLNGNTDHFCRNSVNNAGGFYDVRGLNVYKQTAPGKYAFCFEVPVKDHLKAPSVYSLGEDIIALHHGYRDIVTRAQIFSETYPNNFELIDELECADGDRNPVGALWGYNIDNENRYIIGKTTKGYQKIVNHVPVGQPEKAIYLSDWPEPKPSETLDQVNQLKKDAEDYLYNKYLVRKK